MQVVSDEPIESRESMILTETIWKRQSKNWPKLISSCTLSDKSSRMMARTHAKADSTMIFTIVTYCAADEWSSTRIEDFRAFMSFRTIMNTRRVLRLAVGIKRRSVQALRCMLNGMPVHIRLETIPIATAP
jgi:hypothetical protein